MAQFRVRSYVAVELTIEAGDPDDAVDLAGGRIQELLEVADFEFWEDAQVYDESGELIEDTAE